MGCSERLAAGVPCTAKQMLWLCIDISGTTMLPNAQVLPTGPIPWSSPWRPRRPRYNDVTQSCRTGLLRPPSLVHRRRPASATRSRRRWSRSASQGTWRPAGSRAPLGASCSKSAASTARRARSCAVSGGGSAVEKQGSTEAGGAGGESMHTAADVSWEMLSGLGAHAGCLVPATIAKFLDCRGTRAARLLRCLGCCSTDTLHHGVGDWRGVGSDP